MASGEAIFWKVPPTDVVLPELPAEVNLAPEMNSREVDQAACGVTKNNSQFLEPVQDRLDTAGTDGNA